MERPGVYSGLAACSLSELVKAGLSEIPFLHLQGRRDTIQQQVITTVQRITMDEWLAQARAGRHVWNVKHYPSS